VIIPTFNAASHISRAIDSILTQDFDDYEIVVVDDESTDETGSLVRVYGDRVRYERIEHAGVSGARNHGLNVSTGEFIALLDADDSWLPSKLRLQVSALRDQPSAGVCFAATRYVDELTGRVWDRACAEYPDMVAGLLLYSSIVGPPSAFLARRSLLADVGGFDEGLIQGEDWDLWIRLAQATRFVLLTEPLVEYHIHGSNVSKNVEWFEHDALRVLSNFFAQPENDKRWGHLKRMAYANHFWMFAGGYADHGEFIPSAKYLLLAFAWHPQLVKRIPEALAKRLKGLLARNRRTLAKGHF